MSIHSFILCWFIVLKHELVKSAYTGPARHIVYVLMDDLGWSDISATGGQFPTPYIDSLYDDGIVLNRHYIHYLCSQSRSQFLTGRRCMNQGYGKMQPWGYTQIGGIPIGQPTTANWFREFVLNNPDQNIPQYKTYGVGKWHVGYASEYNTPEYKGFDHYYGFYQSGINYVDKTHPKAEYWGTYALDQFDFFEDEVPAYSALNVTTNTMDLYLYKTEQYLQDFNAAQAANPDETMNMYLYVGGQTLHGPLSRVDRYTDRCKAILDSTGLEYTIARLRVCEYTMMTDDWMIDLVQLLQDYGVWDDTLLIFTADNGADIAVAACNYPLRGTKSTYFEGNIRQLTFINGGDNVIPLSQRGTVRESLISNLDWTPTLLSYAGILDYIDPTDYEWDGVDQLDVILEGDGNSNTDQLLLNINSANIASIDDVDSVSIIFKYEWTTRKGVNKGDGHLYKYVIADVNDDDFNWVKQRLDGWCNINFTNNNSIYVTEIAESDYATSAAIEKKQFLFDLTDDEGEKFNLMRGVKSNGRTLGTKKLNALIRHAKKRITAEIEESNNINFYHEPIDCFWTFLKAGDPGNFEEVTPVHGLYILPFLSGTGYIDRIRNCLDNITTIPAALRDLYLNEWVVPSALVLDEYEMEEEHVMGIGHGMNGIIRGLLSNIYVETVGVIAVIVIAAFCSGLCLNRANYKKGEYQPLIAKNAPYL